MFSLRGDLRDISAETAAHVLHSDLFSFMFVFLATTMLKLLLLKMRLPFCRGSRTDIWQKQQHWYRTTAEH